MQLMGHLPIECQLLLLEMESKAVLKSWAGHVVSPMSRSWSSTALQGGYCGGK